MVASSQTNLLYLADTLPKKYPAFFQRFEKLLKECKINFQLLPGTKDVWAVDYMPVQVRRNEFVRFVYHPQYLQTDQYVKTITDTDAVCKSIGINTIKNKIVLDGGNVVNSANKVIMTERVFKENPSYEREDLANELKQLFQTDELFFIPEQPYDYTGHADGMIRFVDDNTILIKDYKNESANFRKAFEKAIRKTGMENILIPYNPYKNENKDQANGAYINYLQMEDVVIVPIFGLEEDESVVKQFEQIFKDSKVLAINANEIAKDGGVLNCISWNILK